MNKMQMTDQAAKGGVMGILLYLATKANLDPEFIALCMPVVAGALAWASTKIGDPELASFLDAQTKRYAKKKAKENTPAG
jgi:hypothetical protein